MVASYSAAQQAGFAFVVLALVLLAAGVLRRTLPFLRTLHIPAAVVAGFLILLLGPQVLGELTGTSGIFPASSLDTWRVLPGLLINVVFGAIMIGKRIPSASTLWNAAAPPAIFGSVLSFGQFALGSWAVILVLRPLFHIEPEAGALLEMSFAGGHGTIAGMGRLLEANGAGHLVDLGLGLATVSMVTGIVVGAFLVNWAISSPRVTVARMAPVADDETLGLDAVRLEADGPDTPANESGMTSFVFGFALVGAAIAIGIVILELMRWVAHQLGSDIFDAFPLFPLTVIGSLIVQLAVTRLGQGHRIEKQAVSGVSAFALDILIASAIGTMSLATLGHNIPALMIFTIVGVLWSVVGLLVLGPRIHPANWFEHAIADFGQSQGNVATGFVLADMADPDRRTTAANDYGYKQLLYEPLLGGGILTALSVPLIADLGLQAFAVGTTILTIVLIVAGMRNCRGAARRLRG